MSKIKDIKEIIKGLIGVLCGIEVEMSWRCKKCGAWDWGTFWEMLTQFNCKKHKKL